MKKVAIITIWNMFFLMNILSAGAQIEPASEIKDLAKEAQYHAKLDSYNILYPLTEDQAYEKGEVLALEDFENGKYRILVYGLRPSDAIASEEYLHQNHGIEFFPIAGCIVSDGIVGGVKGYNAKMKSLLKEKYGKDIFEEAEAVESE